MPGASLHSCRAQKTDFKFSPQSNDPPRLAQEGQGLVAKVNDPLLQGVAVAGIPGTGTVEALSWDWDSPDIPRLVPGFFLKFSAQLLSSEAA